MACNSENHRRQRDEIPITKTMTLIIGSFIVCWMPITIMFLVVGLTNNPQYSWNSYNIESKFTDYYPYIFCAAATFLSSAINPLIYAFRMKDIRDAVKNLFKCNGVDCAGK